MSKFMMSKKFKMQSINYCVILHLFYTYYNNINYENNKGLKSTNADHFIWGRIILLYLLVNPLMPCIVYSCMKVYENTYENLIWIKP